MPDLKTTPLGRGEGTECDLERIEFMNRLGRVTEHLGLPMDAS
jgi:hypothetical protein